MTKRFVFDLNDEQRAKLEWYRRHQGLRSLAEAVRHLIDEAQITGRHTDEAQRKPMKGFMATLTPEQKEAALAYRGDDTIEPSQGLKGDGATPPKPPGLDVQFGPSKFEPRLKGQQKGKSK